jgi:hypothetical protein
MNVITVCSIEGCRKISKARGWCNTHWYRWYNHGNPLTLKIEHHGLRKTAEYNAWNNMKRRCYEKTNSVYRYYGGRGIRVCERWRNSFTAFYEDMGPKPNATYTLDRIDNNGNYQPDNCVWAAKEEQANNKRNNTIVAFNGRYQTIAQWCKELGLPYDRTQQRLRRGWAPKRAFNQIAP